MRRSPRNDLSKTKPSLPKISGPCRLCSSTGARRGKTELRGYAKVLLGRALMISDVPVNATKGRPWAALASKTVVIEGQHAVDAQGKPRWSALLEWARAQNRFSDAVILAFLEAYPEAPDGGGAAP